MKKLLFNLLLAGAAVCLIVAAARASDDSTARLPAPAPPAPAQVDAALSMVAAERRPDPSDDQPVRMPVVTEKIRRWSRINWTLFFVRTAYRFLVLWLILASGLSARMRDGSERSSRIRGVQVLLYYLNLVGILVAANLPFTIYSGYYLPHAYGLSKQPIPGWLGDIGKSLCVDIATTVPILWGLLWLIQREPRRWPVYLWLTLIPLVGMAIFVMPLIVDPLYNKFTPLPPGSLHDRIHALAVRAGIPNAPILVSDVSKQTEETNAYVTGLGSSARIVLWDTTLRRMPQDEIVSIVGHEMGHYVEKHIYWGYAGSIVALLFGLPLFKIAYDATLVRYGKRWALTGPSDLAAVPAIFLLFGIANFLTLPAQNAVSRYIEHRADAYGLRVTGDPKAMARAFVDLSEQNLSDPNPPAFIDFWLDTHPPLKERIAFALSYLPKQHAEGRSQ